jgi:hypothetical protein
MGLAVRHPHEMYGIICDGSGESQVGGGDMRSSGDILVLTPSLVISARVRRLH